PSTMAVQSQKTVVLFYINRKITMNPAFK
ncbi:hypothetical protein D046_5247B, partial [Vibrio parahaemolyticus V-223/04]